MRVSEVISRTSTPPTRTLPDETSQKRAIRLATVDLPDPDGPTIAQVLPDGTRKLTLSRARGPSSS